MKQFIKFGAIVLAVGCLAAASACDTGGSASKVEEKYATTLPISFVRSGEKTAINPLIYGQFIEHIEDCIYDGIWAEKVLDRKFYYEVGFSGLSPWSATDDTRVQSSKEVTVSGDYAAVISAGGGIRQPVSVQPVDYSGYFWCLSPAGCHVKITLDAEIGSVSAEVDVAASSEFRKYTYSFKGNATTLKGAYTLEVTSGEGTFDSLSLMPADNYHGMRRDTLDALKELGATLYRWPGGNFLSGYDWEDGIGDIDKRPSRRNLHYMGLESDFLDEQAMIASDMIKLRYLGFYGGIEPNDYGLDEFLLMCEYLDAEPLMMVNDGLGTKEQAAAQVEYCNGSTSREYGAMRAANGHAASYNVKYWGVGNEMFGSWQLGNIPQSAYPARHNEFTKAMRAKDNSIRIVAVGNNASTWDNTMFAQSAGNFELIAEHLYGLQDAMDVYAHINNLRSNLQGRISNHRKLLEKYPAQKDVKLAFTEYAYNLATCPSRLKDGMGIGCFMNEIIRNADVVELCSYSSTVNATQGCVTTEAGGAVMQGAGYVLSLYRKHLQSNMLEGGVRWDSNLQLDCSFTISDDGKTIAIAVVNPSGYAVRLSHAAFENAKISRYSLLGDYYDSYNSTQHEEMYLTETQNLANVVAPAMSVSVFVIK